MIKIVYACNDGYMDDLYLSILSILKRSKETFHFFVLSGNFTDLNQKYKCLTNTNVKIINRLIKSFNSKNTFSLIDCTKDTKKLLTNKANISKKKFSPYACLRLLIDLYPEINGKVLYLDCDIMANKDVKKVFDIELGKHEMCVCHNWWLRHVLKKNNFNSGVILFNLKRIKTTQMFRKSRQYFNKKTYTWPDQTALYKAATDYIYFPGDEYRFNYQNDNIQNTTILKHFCATPKRWPKHNNIKQHQIDDVHKYLKIFNFDEDYKYWLNEKQKWPK